MFAVAWTEQGMTKDIAITPLREQLPMPSRVARPFHSGDEQLASVVRALNNRLVRPQWCTWKVNSL